MTDQTLSGVPQGMPGAAMGPDIAGLVAHADDNMVLAQRLGEWISHAPELEIDIALGNIALDHLGVARALYTHAGALEHQGRTEDDFAMGRSEREYANLLLVEQPNGDFAHTIVRQVFFDTYQRELWAGLSGADDETIAGIATKAAKENAYHLEFSSSWLIRLGDGTDESHRRAQSAIDGLWRFTGELSTTLWHESMAGLCAEATLTRPDDPYQRTGGRGGFHTEHLGHLLAEMQWMDRAFPGMQW